MEPRPTYAPSGRVNSADLWPTALALSAGAGLSAVVLALATRGDGDMGFGFWFVPTFGFFCAGRMLVRHAHCRSPRLAAALMVSVGLLAVAGGFHIDQCRRWGVEWHRLDRLPGYITFRMETDGWGVAGANYLPKPVDAGANRGVVPHLGPRLRPNTHWLAFAAEVFLIAVVPALAAAPVARRPYSERLRAWYRQDTVLLTRRSSAALAVALQADAVDEWAESEYETTTRKEDQYPLTIWYCPRPADGADFEPTVYLAPYAAKLARLAPEEVAALAGVFPLLVEWAGVPVEERPISLDQTPPPRDAAMATYSRVPPPHGGRCKDPAVARSRRLSAERATYGRLVCRLALLYLPLATAVVGLLYWIVDQGVGSAAFVTVFVVAKLAMVYVVPRLFQPAEEPHFTAEAGHYRRTLLDQARLRTDALFDPDAPGVVTAEVYPRRLWADCELQADAVEPGLLFVDAQSRRVLFEGDRHRWAVPFAAITGYATEGLQVAIGQEYPLVVLTFLTAEGPKELPLLARTGLPGVHRFEYADALRQLLHQSIEAPQGARVPEVAVG